MKNKCCQKHKEKLRKEPRERYQNLSEEEKGKKRQYHSEGNKNISEEKKEKKVEYMRDYHLAYKNNLRADL